MIGIMDIIGFNLPALLVILPLIMAAIVALIPSSRVAWGLTLLTVLAVAVLAVMQGEASSYELGGWPPPWGIEFVTDGVSRAMAIVISFLSVVSTLYAKELIKKEILKQDIPRVYGAWLLMIGGLMGIVMTGDAFNLFVFLEISSLSAVTLVAMGARGNKRALLAAFNYLLIGAIGATFYVIGVGFCYAITGTLNMADLATRLPEATPLPMLVGLAFMVAGLMVKSAAFPVHTWLVPSYAYAPSAVASLLSAVATKAALYALARILFTVFADVQMAAVLGWILIPLSLAAIFIGTILAIYEDDVKKLLAQSSIAQIGYITLTFGVATTASLTAGFIHIINHAVIKGGLFMAVGAIAAHLSKGVHLGSIKGLGRAMPITSSAMLICGLALIGLPLTSGFISKIYLIRALLEAGHGGIVVLVVLASALSLIYLWKIVEVMWMQPLPKSGRVKENFWIYAPVWILALASVYFGINADIVVTLAHEAAVVLKP